MGKITLRGQYRFWQAAERAAGFVSDRAYLAIRYYRRFGRWPKVARPESFTEHLLAYKLQTRGDVRLPKIGDKAAVKSWVANKIGADHIIPTIWCGPQLPPRSERKWAKPYVIKSTHGSSHTIFVRSDADERWDEIEADCATWLAADAYGMRDREWHYSQIKPQIIVEPFINASGASPPDFKFWTFSGRVALIQVDVSRFTKHRRYMFDTEWKQTAFDSSYRAGLEVPSRPNNLLDMIHLAEKLGSGFEFARVDLYHTPNKIPFGEMTFFPDAGHGRFYPPEADKQVGDLWTAARDAESLHAIPNAAEKESQTSRAAACTAHP